MNQDVSLSLSSKQVAEALQESLARVPLEQWCRVLKVLVRDILDWKKGTSVPSPGQLRDIVEVLDRMRLDGCLDPVDSRETKLHQVLDVPLTGKARVAFDGAWTLGEYMLRPKVERFEQLIGARPWREKEAILLAIATLIRGK